VDYPKSPSKTVAGEAAGSEGYTVSERPSTKPPAVLKGSKPKDPLEGMTLEKILVALVERYGWEELGRTITINCFMLNPSISSSLKFLRRTPWARAKVEQLYLDSLQDKVRS
jgi:uncharacterized protein (DUF2132 family)